MAKAKQPKRREPADLLEQDRVRTERLRVKLEAAQIKTALSYYAAADKGRRNKDWKAPTASADLAIIPDSLTVATRARMAVANTWTGNAASRSQKRNVVGRGIMVVPAAKDPAGDELADVNRVAADRFMRWASSHNDCDVERKRTFWQFQRNIVGEEFITGVGFLVWSYRPNPKNVGLRLQMFEFEQLDRNIQRFENNEVRGGVEIDADCAPVAYHFYRRTLNDLLGNQLEPIRVPAERVFAYYDAERAHQTGFMSRLAPVLQSIRDFGRYNGVTLDRAYMESCIGMAITKNAPIGAGGTPFGMPRSAGDTGVTASGMSKVDFVPGMVPILQPGEDIKPIMPTTPGNMFEPFSEVTLRGIGAGMGMSYGALTRHNDANYSAARQDMLEDAREIEPQQDSLIDHIVLPVYELWFRLAVFEGRLPDVSDSEFLSDTERFVDADYVAPARPWIDPEKEVNAYKTAIELRIKTRSEIVAMDGGSFRNKLRAIKQEKDEAAELDITFPEDAAQAPKAAPAFAPPEQPAASLKQLAAVADAPPNYRPATNDAACAGCKYRTANNCGAYSGLAVGDHFVCDAFESSIQPITVRRTILPAMRMDGEPDIDQQIAIDDANGR